MQSQHIEAHVNKDIPTRIRIVPEYETDGVRTSAVVNPDETLAIPQDPSPARGRGPLRHATSGYAILEPGSHLINVKNEQQHRSNLPNRSYLSEQQFNEIANKYRSEDGRYVAMTCYGAVPVPDDLLKEVPESFVEEPIVREQKHFVTKQKRHERVIEQDYVQHQHHFVEVVKSGVLNKIVKTGGDREVEIPHYNYKGIIADNIVEVPQGSKYIEIPLEVVQKKPPKLVPVPKPIVIQRFIECTKPVIQEKIVEVPKIIKKSVPKEVVKEIPYYVPKYVTKVVDLPYKPGMQLPEPTGKMLPESPLTPPRFIGIGNPTTIVSGSDTHLLIADDQNKLINEDGTAFVDDEGLQCSLAPGGSGWYDGRGNYYPNSNNMSAPSPSASIMSPASIKPLLDPPFCVGDGHIEGTSVVFHDSETPTTKSVIVPQGIKDIKLPFEAEIEVSVIAVDPVTGEMFEQQASEFNRNACNQSAQTPGFPDEQYPAQNSYMPFNPQVDESYVTSGSVDPQYDNDMNSSKLLEPIIRNDAPAMRDLNVSSGKGHMQVMTNSGLRNLDTLHWTCGDPAGRLRGPFQQSGCPVPLNEEGEIDVEALGKIKEEYLKRMHPNFNTTHFE